MQVTEQNESTPRGVAGENMWFSGNGAGTCKPELSGNPAGK